MRCLAVILLLAISPSAERSEQRRAPAIAGLQARQTLPPELARPDPCAVARELARQRPCLAAGDCPALEAWTRAFGPPGMRPLDPERPRKLAVAGRLHGWRPGAPVPPTPPLVRPGVVCPLGDEPRR